MERKGGWGHPQWEGLRELESKAKNLKSKGCNGVYTYMYPSKYKSVRTEWKKANLVEHFIFWKE